MATFSTDPNVPLSKRARAFADDLEREGERDSAAQVRTATDAYVRCMAQGEALDALQSLSVLRRIGQRHHSYS